MSNTFVQTKTDSYTISDIENVVRRLAADFMMIAQSSGSITELDAENYTYDIMLLASMGYLKEVDLTLFCGPTEIRAIQYVVSTSADVLTMARPGGVMWPRVDNPYLRIVLSYTKEYNYSAREMMMKKLRNTWVPTDADTSHVTLNQAGSRDYASNGWGMMRKDYSA